MTRDEMFRIEKDGFVASLILNRAKQHNAMTFEFFDELKKIFDEFDQDTEVRVVVIKAEGKTFTAGLDLVAANELLGDGSAFHREWFKAKIKGFQDAISALEKCSKPVIAAIHGKCIGGGIDLTSACDVRMASRDAVFSIRETRIGIVADVGTLQRVPYIIGYGWFRLLALTGRDFNADQALRIGYITQLCESRDELYEKAHNLAVEIAGLPPMTVQGVKEIINYSRDMGVYPGLEYVAQKNAAIIPNEDMLEAVAAFMEKREPKFTGR